MHATCLIKLTEVVKYLAREEIDKREKHNNRAYVIFMNSLVRYETFTINLESRCYVLRDVLVCLLPIPYKWEFALSLK